MENGLILFRKDKDVRAGKERAFHIHIRRIPCTPGSLTQNTSTEFCKTAATATTQPSETTMDRAFQGVVAPPFFIQKKGMLPPLSPVFYPGTTDGGEKTGGGGGPNDGKRRRVRTDRTTVAYRQKHGCNQSKPQ